MILWRERFGRDVDTPVRDIIPSVASTGREVSVKNGKLVTKKSKRWNNRVN